MKTTVILESLGKPTLNGNIYTRECIEKAIKQLDGPLFITEHVPFNFDLVRLDDVCGTVKNLRIENDDLVGDVQALEGWSDIFDQLDESLYIRPNGIANVSKDGVISNYTFVSTTLTKTPA